MAVDPLSPIAPARVRCLLIPCGRITRARFLSFAERIQRESVVRLGDVSPNGKSSGNMFSPLAFPTGLVLYDFCTSAPSAEHQNLVPFELYREVEVVLGIADGVELSHEGEGQTAADGVVLEEEGLEGIQFATIAKEQCPTALAHQLLVFDCDRLKMSSKSNSPPAPFPVAIPSPARSKITTMKTVMCDITSILLAEMSSFARSVQALPHIGTPRPRNIDGSGNGSRGEEGSKLDPRLSIIGDSRIDSRSSSPGGSVERHSHRQSMPVNLPSHIVAELKDGRHARKGSQANDTRAPPLTFDEIASIPERPASVVAGEESCDASKERSKDRVSVHGFGSGSVGERARNKAKGRIAVVVGSMYLLSGRWLDAIAELTEGATIARTNSDHVWHAKALDYIIVAILMCAWTETSFEIPAVCHPLGDKLSPGLKDSSRRTPTGSMPDLGDLKSPNPADRIATLQSFVGLLPDLINNILHLYVRAANFTADQLPQISFSESVVRFARLMAVIQAYDGRLNPQCLGSIILNEEIKLATEDSAMEPITFPTKGEISAVLFRAVPTPLAEKGMELSDRIALFAGIASCLLILEYHRKRVFILRELMLVLLPALIQSRKDSAAELGIHPAASLSSQDFGSQNLHVKAGLSGAGPDTGVQRLLRMVCEVYGVILQAPDCQDSSTSTPQIGTNDNESSDKSQLVLRRVQVDSTLRTIGNCSLKYDILRSCINICEALPDLHGVLYFATALLYTAGSGTAPGPEDREGSPDLPIEDQSRVLNSVLRTIGAAQQLGIGIIEADYWDEFLIRDVTILDTPSTKAPKFHRKDELGLASTEGSAVEGPFIHNPFGSKVVKPSKETLLIAGEIVTFAVLLQNLYDFELEVERIVIEAEQGVLRAQAEYVKIGPYSTRTVLIEGIPSKSGKLEICGCRVKIRGCRERSFLVFRDPWRQREHVKIKGVGMMAGQTLHQRTVSSMSDKDAILLKKQNKTLPKTTTVSADIINPQPNVMLESTSLSQSSIMLLEGETKVFSITLRNISTVPIDLILLSFSDSTSGTLQAVLNNKNLPPSERYEAELVAYHKQAFRWLQRSRDAEHYVAPGENIILEVEVFGKPELTNGFVHVEYGHLGQAPTELKDGFYTRQISIPISITVNASLNLIRNDVLPFTGHFAWHFPNRQVEADKQSTPNSFVHFSDGVKAHPLLQQVGNSKPGTEQCLLILDFYNAWPTPLSVILEMRDMLAGAMEESDDDTDEWRDAYKVKETLQPGRTSRIVVLLPWLNLPHAHSPIPSLNPANRRQFVLSASKISPEVERANREAFWYREEVLKHIRASWEEVTGSRLGGVELRGLRLSSRMVETIKLEEVSITMSLEAGENDQAHLRETGRSRFEVQSEMFATVIVCISNSLEQPIYPLLRLQPSLRNQPYNVALDLGKKFAFNGLLQRSLPLIEAGETKKIRIGVTFLCAGEYELGASVEELRICNSLVPEQRNQDERHEDFELRVEERNGRRVWYAKEACMIDVLDEES